MMYTFEAGISPSGAALEFQHARGKTRHHCSCGFSKGLWSKWSKRTVYVESHVGFRIDLLIEIDRASPVPVFNPVNPCEVAILRLPSGVLVPFAHEVRPRKGLYAVEFGGDQWRLSGPITKLRALTPEETRKALLRGGIESGQ